MSDFNCVECFDTGTIDYKGGEVRCPYCGHKQIKTVKLTGLGHGLGDVMGSRYNTCVDYGSSFMVFVGYETAILKDVAAVRRADMHQAAQRGLKGRNSVSSGAIAVERRVRAAL